MLQLQPYSQGFIGRAAQHAATKCLLNCVYMQKNGRLPHLNSDQLTDNKYVKIQKDQPIVLVDLFVLDTVKHGSFYKVGG